jgi:uncharacterized membrane protein YccC
MDRAQRDFSRIVGTILGVVIAAAVCYFTLN